MKDFSNIFLLSDMDGTLINSQAEISMINKYALNEFVNCGGTFAVATGRTLAGCKPYLNQLPLNAPSIFFNGTILENTQDNSVLKTLSLETTKLFSFLKKCLHYAPNLSIQLHTKDKFYIITDKQYDDPIIYKENASFIRAKLDDLIKLDILKIQIYTPDAEKISWLYKFAESMKLHHIAKYFTSWASYFEIIPKTASKGIMLETLRQMPLYQDKIFIAVGDFDNDIEMLLFADLGIAAQNATDNLKQVADLISVSCDDHLLQHIIHNIIPNMDKLMLDSLQTA